MAWPNWASGERVADTARATDAELAKAAVRGERDAFARLVEQHHRAVFALCYRLLRERDEAGDAAQEAFVRAYASIASFDVAQPFAPWVLRIARNHCLDLLRRRLPADRVVALDAPRDEDDVRPRDLVDERAERGDEKLERAQTAQALDAAVAALPEKYRTVVSLYHQQHLTYQQIAEVLNVPIGTVMTWLHRARAQLRKQLAGAEEVAP
ncbi:MAG: sigma-70 family RNA polymerase sigma factor [Deltaproteobacteria bacterium]|nr:sigma-70 family RNA polymerase sigma factor [Deltaproteobacteria bacterium]